MAIGLSDAPIPFAVVAGKRAQIPFPFLNTGITDPAEVTAIELRVAPATSIEAIAEAEALTWTLGGGDFREAYLDGQQIVFALDIGDAITGGMRPGRWRGLLSIGRDGAPPEEPLLNITLSVTKEP